MGRPPDRRVGNLTAFSFYVTKNITTVEGGAIMTEDHVLASAAERLAMHGLSDGAWQRFSDPGFRHYEVVQPGFKFNMTDVQAALGLHQLPRLDDSITYRAEQWDRYDALLDGLPMTTPRRRSRGHVTRATSTRCCSTRTHRSSATNCSTRWPQQHRYGRALSRRPPSTRITGTPTA